MEVLVSVSVLGLLTGMLLMIYISGASVTRKGDTRAELVADAQVALANMTSDLERSPAIGISVAGDRQSLAVLSAMDEQGQFQLDDEGRAVWQRWHVYYTDNGELRKASVNWTADPLTRATPIPIDSLSPPLTVNDYETGGRVLARNVYGLDVEILANGNTSLKLELRKKRYGRPDPETFELQSEVRSRNP